VLRRTEEQENNNSAVSTAQGRDDGYFLLEKPSDASETAVNVRVLRRTEGQGNNNPAVSTSGQDDGYFLLEKPSDANETLDPTRTSDVSALDERAVTFNHQQNAPAAAISCDSDLLTDIAEGRLDAPPQTKETDNSDAGLLEQKTELSKPRGQPHLDSHQKASENPAVFYQVHEQENVRRSAIKPAPPTAPKPKPKPKIALRNFTAKPDGSSKEGDPKDEQNRPFPEASAQP
jgi:hypothetical protein